MKSSNNSLICFTAIFMCMLLFYNSFTDKFAAWEPAIPILLLGPVSWYLVRQCRASSNRGANGFPLWFQELLPCRVLSFFWGPYHLSCCLCSCDCHSGWPASIMVPQTALRHPSGHLQCECAALLWIDSVHTRATTLDHNHLCVRHPDTSVLIHVLHCPTKTSTTWVPR